MLYPACSPSSSHSCSLLALWHPVTNIRRYQCATSYTLSRRALLTAPATRASVLFGVGFAKEVLTHKWQQHLPKAYVRSLWKGCSWVWMSWHAKQGQNGHITTSHTLHAHLLLRCLGPAMLCLMASAVFEAQAGEGIHVFLVVCTQNPAEALACNRTFTATGISSRASQPHEAQLQLCGEDQHNKCQSEK